MIVEYKPDPETDMFQIGRSSEPPIDFVVMDTVAGEKHGEAKVPFLLYTFLADCAVNTASLQ